MFYPNYRGSTGRGVEFSMMGQSDAAGKEFSDLIACVGHLISAGITAPDTVSVTGGSYGGYASVWCSTFYSDRFAASVMFVGISDNVSKVGTTDIPDEMFWFTTVNICGMTGTIFWRAVRFGTSKRIRSQYYYALKRRSLCPSFSVTGISSASQNTKSSTGSIGAV